MIKQNLPISPIIRCIMLAVWATTIWDSNVANACQTKNEGDRMVKKYAIAIHGGAGGEPKKMTDKENEARTASLEKALRIGVEILEKGGSSLDACEAVVRFLEDDSQFNAGKGAVYDAKGGHQLDASIMDGKTLACGAVAGVTRVKNPISLARRVMTDTPHVLLATDGAEEFAKSIGAEMVEPNHFDTPEAKAKWENYKKENPDKGNSQNQNQVQPNNQWVIGTVGCVALDSHGDLAAATSTGGMTHKKFGRVGDSPIVGAGTYADNKTCAVSCTGTGEQYIRHAVAYDVSSQIKYRGASLQGAVDDNLNNRLDPDDGGLIAVDKEGNIAMGYNTPAMARGAADSSGRFEVHWHK